MKWSKLLIQTLREDPGDAEIDSHKLMVRAGLMKKVAGVSMLREFGAAEAVWHLDVVDFRGVVAMDAHGHSLFDTVRQKSETKLASLI